MRIRRRRRARSTKARAVAWWAGGESLTLRCLPEPLASPAAMRDLFASNSTAAAAGASGASAAAVASDAVWNGVPTAGVDSSSMAPATSTSLRRAFLLLLSPLAFVCVGAAPLRRAQLTRAFQRNCGRVLVH